METLNEQLEGGNMSKEATTGLQLSHINNQTEWSFQVCLDGQISRLTVAGAKLHPKQAVAFSVIQSLNVNNLLK